MKYIVQGGITSRNIPPNSMDAISLAILSPYLAGVQFNVYQTRDKEIVIYQTSTVDNGKEKISDLTLHNLMRRNFGTNIRRHPIVKLEEALTGLKNTNKIIVLSLEDSKDITFVNRVLEITGKFPNLNIYIKSSILEVIMYLKEASKKERIGAIIWSNTSSFWKIDLDFYSLPYDLIDEEKVKEKLRDNKIIMIENVKTKEMYQKIKDQFQNDDAIYLIANTFSTILDAFIV